MKTFYLLRHKDVHGNSGEGVVAEGVIFDNGMCAMTWLSNIQTVTIWKKITEVKKIHGHEGLTDVIIEGKSKKFDWCVEQAKLQRQREKQEKKG